MKWPARRLAGEVPRRTAPAERENGDALRLKCDAPFEPGDAVGVSAERFHEPGRGVKTRRERGDDRVRADARAVGEPRESHVQRNAHRRNAFAVVAVTGAMASSRRACCRDVRARVRVLALVRPAATRPALPARRCSKFPRAISPATLLGAFAGAEAVATRAVARPDDAACGAREDGVCRRRVP